MTQLVPERDTGSRQPPVSAAVPGIDHDEFDRIVDAAALSCPVSQALLRNVEIDVDQQLE